MVSTQILRVKPETTPNLTANRNSWEEGSNRLDRRRCGLSEFPNCVVVHEIVWFQELPLLLAMRTRTNNVKLYRQIKMSPTRLH